MKNLVQLPNELTLKQFKQEIYNLYYGRDNGALEKLLNGCKEAKCIGRSVTVDHVVQPITKD